MFKSIVVAMFLAFLLSACSSSSDTALTQQEEAEMQERCKQLLQEAEDLKGRPVRRGAALEYYQNECVLRGEY